MGAVVIELIRDRGHTSGDVALALMFYGGIAGGVLITGLGGQSAALLQTYLFGSITTISPTDVWVTVGLAALVVTMVRRAVAPAVRGRPRPRVRPRSRAARPALQRGRRRTRRGHR